jgi:hypothetical protein
MGKYYINEYIKNITKKNSNIEELDDVEKELDKLANTLLEEGLDPFNDDGAVRIMSKFVFDDIPKPVGIQITIIKQDDNSEYAIMISQGKSSYNVIFVNEEHFNYFNNKFIKYSAKDFIINSLIYYATNSDKLDSLATGDYKNNDEKTQAVIDTLALDGFKFRYDDLLLNDIDVRYLKTKNPLFFDKNETKKIFNIKQSTDSDSHIEFVVESINNVEIRVTNADPYGNEYKYLRENTN